MNSFPFSDLRFLSSGAGNVVKKSTEEEEEQEDRNVHIYARQLTKAKKAMSPLLP